MRAITLTQPWATLVAIGAKQYETRGWAANYRGPLAIHAAKNLAPIGGPAGLDWFYRHEPFHSVLVAAGYTAEPDRELPRGALVATVELVYCLPADEVRRDLEVDALAEIDGTRELVFGDYASGRFAWRLANLQPLIEPVACRGAQGLWDVPDDLLPLIESRAREPEAVSPAERAEAS